METLDMGLTFQENDLLIDTEFIDFVGEFHNLDEKKDFEKNKNKTNPVYLGDKKIEYKHNNKGYRTKNIEDLDKDFVLVFGCSHTEGIGNFYEDIWCNVLFDRIGIDSLNLAKSGTGPDIQYYNTVQYLKCNYLKPKLVIYQWPQSTRKSFAYYNDQRHNCITLQHHHTSSTTATKDTKWYLKRYCMDQSELQINNYFWIASANMMWELNSVPVLNWSWTGDFYNDYHKIKLVQVDNTHNTKEKARDRAHDGPKQHRQTAEILFKDVDNLIKKCLV